MTTSFLASAGSSMPANSSASIDPSASANSCISAGLVSLPTASLDPSMSPGTVMLVIQDKTKSFYTRKLAISANNTTVLMYTKDTTWIISILVANLNKAWHYMLGIPNHLQ